MFDGVLTNHGLDKSPSPQNRSRKDTKDANDPHPSPLFWSIRCSLSPGLLHRDLLQLSKPAAKAYQIHIHTHTHTATYNDEKTDSCGCNERNEFPLEQVDEFGTGTSGPQWRHTVSY